jgi:hypothetical protein
MSSLLLKSVRCVTTVAMLLALALTGTAALAQGERNADDLYLDALQAINEGRYEDAKTLFAQVVEKVPLHAGAWLDLAISQCELGNKAEADRLFQQVLDRFHPEQAIRDEIERRRTQGCTAPAPRAYWAISAERGIDSNVNQGASNPSFTLGTGASQIELQLQPDFLPKQDRYSTLTTDFMRELPYGGATGFAQLRFREYDTLHQFNTSAGALGLERSWRWKNWNVQGTAMGSLLTLDGKLYQKQEMLQFRATPPLNLAQAWRASLLAGVSHIQYPTLVNYDSNIWELRGLLTYQTPQWNALASLGWLADRAGGDRQGGHRQGWYASATARHRLYHDVVGELGWTRQTWQSGNLYSPGLIDLARYQDTQITRAAVIIPTLPRQSLQLEFRNVANRENISLLQYDSRSIQVSYHWRSF